MIFLFSQAPPAKAQGHDRPLKLTLDLTEVQDSNVFRVPDGNTDPVLVRGLTGRSDRISTTRFGLQLDKSYAQQRVTFVANQARTRYDKFAFLDANSFNYRGAWEWHLTPRISGTFSADRSEAQIGFDDTTNLTRNLTVLSNKNFSLDGWLSGGWHVTGGVSEATRKASLFFAALPDFTQTTGELGARYIAPSGNFISFTQRLRQGSISGPPISPAFFIDRQFTVRESELYSEWNLSGKSSLKGRLTWISRRNPNVPQRDFSGYAGDLRYVWKPAGRLEVELDANRQLTPFTPDTRTSYRVDDAFTVSPVWTVTDHTTLGMSAVFRTTNYLGPVFPVAGPLRRDTQRTVQLIATWTPHPKVTLRALVQRDRRQSNNALFNFDDATANLTASLAF